MASIREVPRNDGTTAHTVLYRLDGRQRTLVFDDPKAAEVFRDTINVHGPKRAMEMHNIDPEPRRRNKVHVMTVAEWVRHHIDHLTGVEQTTIDKYDDYLKNDIEPHLGHIPLKELSSDDLARWVKHMETHGGRKGTGHAPKTLANKYGFLSGALNAAVTRKPKPLIESNPAAGRKLSRAEAPDSEDDEDIRILTHDEFDVLLDAVTDYWKLLIEFMVTTGLRWGEAAALEPKHVNLADGTIKIRQAWKYSRTNGYYLGPPKTKRSRRTVDVPTEMLDRLDLSDEFVFMNTTGGPVRYHGFKRRVWDAAVKKSGLDPRPTPHDLRHTYASWQLIGGTPITVVSRQLGHESIQVTVDIYGDVDRASAKVASEYMSRTLAARKQPNPKPQL
jgi:integrase